MGGNALRDFGECTRRITAEEFYNLSSEIVTYLKSLHPDSWVTVVPSFRNKKDHGDIDILIDAESQILSEFMNSLDKDIPRVKNGPILSFSYQNTVQVDLIEIPREEYKFALNYFSFNDLGNLCGRVFRKVGFKFGHNGLFYVYRDEENSSLVHEEVLVTRDYDKALSFLDYPSLSDWSFDELEDVFKFAMLSPAATKYIFLLENRNHTSKVRDRKRKTYIQFLEWLETHPETEVSSELIYMEDKEAMLNLAMKFFEGFFDRLCEARSRAINRKIISMKFNGELVEKLTGLSGKDLGVRIRSMKSSKADFNQFVLETPYTEIVKFIREFSDEDFIG